MSKVKLNLAEFIAAFPDHATITDFVKYNGTTAEYAPATDPLVGTGTRKPDVAVLANSKGYDIANPTAFIAAAPEGVIDTVNQGTFSVDGTTTVEIYNSVNQAGQTAAIRFASSSNKFCMTFICMGTVGTPQRAGAVKITEENIAEAKTLIIDGTHSLYDLWQVAFPYGFTKE